MVDALFPLVFQAICGGDLGAAQGRQAHQTPPGKLGQWPARHCSPMASS